MEQTSVSLERFGGLALNGARVEICGVNTSSLPLLTDEEQYELLKKTKEGDKKSRELFIKGNIRLVLSIIKRFKNTDENPDDLFQIGCIGLIKAIDNFDLSIGVKFSTYAVPLIFGEVRRYLRDNYTIRVSRSIKDLAYKSMAVAEQIRMKENREPLPEEIAEILGCTKKEVSASWEAIQAPVSLYEPVCVDKGEGLYIMDQISDNGNKEEYWVSDIDLERAIEGLNDREKDIIHMRYFEGLTQMEVAKEVSISQAQVSRLEKSAIKSIRKYLE
ncbi:MAG: RNA polymerase sporulation sigma factor SigG [Clostridiales bacterium]|nr:RNA polymerase sporulation sigma factor SigG [Clostridiales bacterium]